MKTRYWIIRPGSSCEFEIDWPKAPGIDRIKEIILPTLHDQRPGSWLEHVAVLFDGKRASMFVDEAGALAGLPINREATQRYHAASIARGEKAIGGIIPGAPMIHGAAILFDRNVWS